MPNNHNPKILRESFPGVWTKDSPLELATNHAPLVIELCPKASNSIPLLPVKSA